MTRVAGSRLDPNVRMFFLDEANLARRLSQSPGNRKFLLRSVGDCCSSVHTKEEGIYNPSSHSTHWAPVNVHKENKQALLRVTCVASGHVIAEARCVVHGTCWLCDVAARAARGETRCRWRVAIGLMSRTRSLWKDRPHPDQERNGDPSVMRLFSNPFTTA